MGNGCKWNVGALNDVHTWSHTTCHEIKFWTCTCIHHQKYCAWNKLIRGLLDPKMAQMFLGMPHKALACYFWWSTTCTCSFVHVCRKELPSHLNHLALSTTWSHSLDVNPTKTLHTSKYAITYAFWWIFKAPSPSNWVFASLNFSLPMLV